MQIMETIQTMQTMQPMQTLQTLQTLHTVQPYMKIDTYKVLSLHWKSILWEYSAEYPKYGKVCKHKGMKEKERARILTKINS